jgi:hypothetical protein
MRSTLHDPLLTAENRLWRAVLEQAYADAESLSDAVSDNADDGPPERTRARCYLRGDGKQEAAALTMVCGFAEIPADRVLNWARRNYPRSPSQTQSRSNSQTSLAIGATETRHTRARSNEYASA